MLNVYKEDKLSGIIKGKVTSEGVWTGEPTSLPRDKIVFHTDFSPVLGPEVRPRLIPGVVLE